MKEQIYFFRFFLITVMLMLGMVWSLVSARQVGSTADYPHGELLATPRWLHEHLNDEDLLVVDVRSDDHFDGRLIPGAVRLPWSSFRYNDTAANVASRFVGVVRAQITLGDHGVGRPHRIVLYDSVERDGGATASYVFWILDILGHADKRILEGGIDAWADAGYDLDAAPRQLSPVLYQAPMEDIRGRELIDGDDVYRQLGDPHYQLIDVRSPAEYNGDKGTRDLQGNGLKRGHIPTAVNVDYTANWVDPRNKRIKPYDDLQRLYRGLDPHQSVIVYCNSGRRSSFSYFVLRLMGIDNVLTYEPSWKEWGHPDNFFPVETTPRRFAGQDLPGVSRSAPSTASSSGDRRSSGSNGSTNGNAPKGGYVSCGG